MGSSYHGANSDCYHCTGCGTYRACDDCSANCCINNMNSHRALRRLEDRFVEKVNQCPKDTCDYCISKVQNLKKDYDIKIYYEEYNDYLEQSKHIIEKLETRKEFIKKKENSIKEDYFVKYRLKDLECEHKNNMEKIRNEFSEKAKKYKKESADIIKLKKEIKEKKKEKNNLIEEKDEINSKKNSQKKKFIDENQKVFEEKFIKEKNEIDLNYCYLQDISYNIKEYSQDEKELKNALLENIRRIKNYKIPEFFIYNLGLINYLY